MRLLVTNDDGIDSVFLHELVFALRAEGHELAVAAPRHEQSWIGAAKSRNRAVAAARSSAHENLFGCPAWVIDGTPSDCVNIALAHLIGRGGPQADALQIDGVVSGINVGLNASLGFVLASGTIAGAWEGALHGLPAVAFSQDLTFEEYDRLKYGGQRRVPLDGLGALSLSNGQDTSPTVDVAATYGGDPEVVATVKRSAAIGARLATELISGAGRNEFTVHNINFPHRCPADAKVVRTVPAQVVVPELFGPAQDDGTHRFVFKLGEDVSPGGRTTDRAALAAGFVSHTVLDYRALGLRGG